MAIASSRALRACALLCASVSFPSMAHAQLAGEIAPPQRASVDENGVNVATGTYRNPHTDLTIGSGPGALAATRIYGQMPYLNTAILVRNNTYASGSGITINTGDTVYTFMKSGSVWVTQGGDGASLTGDNNSSNTNIFVMTLADGTVFTYNYMVEASHGIPQNVFLSSIQRPNGLTTTLNWETRDYCNYNNASPGQGCNSPGAILTRVRLDSVTSSAGYQVNYTYQAQNYTGNQNQPAVQWQTLIGASGSNNQGGSGTLPSVTYVQGTTTPSGSVYNQTNDVTDATNRRTRYTKQYGGGSYEAVQLPGSSGNDLTVNMTDAGIVTSVVRGGQTWTYSYSVSGSISHLTVTDPTGWARRYTSNLSIGLPTQIVDQFGRTTSYAFDTSGRLMTGTSPGGQVTTYSYDANSNVTNTVVTQAGGGATISTSATYPSNCTGRPPCNLPTTTTDANGNVTSYSYDPTTFALTNVTRSAGANGIKPHTSYGYGQVNGVQMPISTSTCRTQSSCAGTADEVKTTTAYNANLLPASVTSGAGDGTLSATTAATYTAAGDVLTVDGPLAGTADTTRSYYDAMRRSLGTIGADPDGSGPLPSRAARANYDAQGRVASQDYGTATGQGDSDLSNMAVSQTTTATFDAVGHVVSTTLSSGGPAYARSEASYDAAGRTICQTLRMNPSAFTAGTATCTLGTAGSLGADRITQTAYSSSSPSVSITSAYGTADAATESVAYTLTGKTSTVTDANGNVTTYGYDGFDRAQTTTYPGGSYDQVSYDANSNVTSRRLRDGQVLNYSYDALNNRTYDDNPGMNVAEVDVTYTYDNLGHVLKALDQNGWYTASTYDALGRMTAQSSNASSTAFSFSYDLAGNLLRQTWPDGFYVTYDHLVTGEVSVVHENGGLALATFGYDNLGRRTSLTRGNGTVTSYGFDAVSRLTSLSQDLAGTSQDLSLTFGYNPAGQITSRTSSNDAYAFTQSYNVDRSYTTNGLNQYTQTGSIAPTYDARGNLTQAGGQTYQYNTRNQLFQTGTTGQLFYRNPAGTLSQILSGGTATALEYVGSLLATEYSGSGTTRYVYGPGSDEPLVWYNGSGTSDRRYLHADERGSVIAVTNDAGTAIAINSYDEYGIPASGNIGRFQYTGQKWIPELGMYDYKARMYSPTLGRFLQTDTIGYGDGLNWYNYVGGDPVNLTDPSGLSYLICSDGATIPKGYKSQGGDPCTETGHGVFASIVTGDDDRDPTPSPQSQPSPFSLRSLFPSLFPPNNFGSLGDIGGISDGQPQRDNNTCRPVNSGKTVQVGLSGQGTFGIFSYQLAVGVAFDSHGNVALYGTFGPGGGVGGGGAAGLSLQGSNALTVQDLGGFFTNGSGGGGLAIGGTVDGFGGYARNGQPIVGGGVTAGAAGGETSFGGVTDTFISPSLNLLGRPTC